ncbi:MAG: N-acetylneuraminate synthase family protein [Pseudodesulfovibrio sp.]|nr:N-acetylneuraminate synthase family protein [Pseudodesulfovibrio sp.]
MDYETLIQNAERNLFIIGEAGVNHNGDLATAKKLVDVARVSGCDAVKFQTWKTEKVYCRERSIKPEYQIETTDEAESEYDTIKKLELSFDEFKELKEYCDSQEIVFLSTPDEQESADFLIDELQVPMMKTASQDVTNIPFLRYLGKKKLPLIFSTGASTLEEVLDGVSTILRENDALIILHCLSSYPAPLEDLNLNAIPELARLTNCPVGFSDHTVGVEASCAALALGARIFEKHFTLSHDQAGPDHQASLTPEGLTRYVSTLREIRKALGDGHKRVMPSETSNRKAFRRYLVFDRDIKKGELFSPDDFLFKKVADGVAPKHLDEVVGSRASEDISEGDLFHWKHLAK